MDIFIFDNTTNRIFINEHTILLVKEFKDLWNVERNKCKEDPTGELRLRAYKEFTYLYLYLDWKSIYHKYLEQEKKEAALIDSGLTEEELQDEVFKTAVDKYREIQDSDRILSLIKTAYRTLYKTEVFLDNIDFNNDVDEMGKPIFTPANVMKDIAGIAKMRKELQTLEEEYKSGLKAQSKIRADQDPGVFDM